MIKAKAYWIIGLLMVSVFTEIRAQYDFNAGQIIKTIEFYNPGYNAMKENLSAIVLYRGPFHKNKSFTSPNYVNDLSYTTTAINLYYPFLKTKTGFSFNLIDENIGHRENMVTDLAFDVAVRTSNKSFLSLGIAGGMNLWQYNLSEALHNYGDVALGDYNASFPYLSLGLNFFKRGHHLGVSYHLASPKGLGDLSGLQNYDNDARLYQTIYVNTSIQIALSNQLHLKPFIIFKSRNFVPDNFLVEAGMNFLITDRVWIGAAYRDSWVNDAFSVMADVKILDYLRFGYSYEHSINSVGFLTASIHEIRLQFDLPRKVKDPYIAQTKTK